MTTVQNKIPQDFKVNRQFAGRIAESRHVESEDVISGCAELIGTMGSQITDPRTGLVSETHKQDARRKSGFGTFSRLMQGPEQPASVNFDGECFP